MDEYRAGQPATARQARLGSRSREGDIVGHDHDFDLVSLGPRQLGGKPEIEPVARVVLDDQEDSGGSRDGVNGGQDGVGRG